MYPEKQTDVVVLGGGYAGTLAAIRLAGKIKGKAVTVTLVNGSDHFVERIRHHQVAAGQHIQKRSFAKLLDKSGVHFRQGWCTAIDPRKKQLTLQSRSGSETVTYDYLIYALGSTINQEAINNIQIEADAAVFNLGNEEKVRQLMDQLPTIADLHGHLLVIGGGLTGIEAATEIAERYPQLRVTLVTRGKLGAALSAAGATHLHKVFTKLGIELIEETTVERLTEGVAHLQDKRTVAFDAVLWAGSFVVPLLAGQAGLPVDRQGRILVDDRLRVQSYPEIYAAGDAAATELRMACATAMPMGAYVADHLAARLLIQPEPGPFQFAYFMQCISLGRNNGLIQLVHEDDRPKAQVFTGWPAARIKEFICRFTLWSLWWEKQWPGVYSWPQRQPSATTALSPQSKQNANEGITIV